MVIIQFENETNEDQAFEWLAGRFSFKTWENGDMLVHENALPHLAREGVRFKVKGPASYEHFVPTIRTADPLEV
jgi:hypothetical protein